MNIGLVFRMFSREYTLLLTHQVILCSEVTFPPFKIQNKLRRIKLLVLFLKFQICLLAITIPYALTMVCVFVC